MGAKGLGLPCSIWQPGPRHPPFNYKTILEKKPWSRIHSLHYGAFYLRMLEILYESVYVSTIFGPPGNCVLCFSGSIGQSVYLLDIPCPTLTLAKRSIATEPSLVSLGRLGRPLDLRHEIYPGRQRELPQRCCNLSLQTPIGLGDDCLARTHASQLLCR